MKSGLTGTAGRCSPVLLGLIKGNEKTPRRELSRHVRSVLYVFYDRRRASKSVTFHLSDSQNKTPATSGIPDIFHGEEELFLEEDTHWGFLRSVYFCFREDI